MAPIYSISASSRLAWPRYTVYRLQTGLHGLDIQYISFKQACMASIYSISAPNRLAWSRYTVYRLQTGLHGLDIQYIGSKQACMVSIYSISAPNRLAWSRYTVYRLQTGLHGFDIHSDIELYYSITANSINTERNETHTHPHPTPSLSLSPTRSPIPNRAVTTAIPTSICRRNKAHGGSNQRASPKTDGGALFACPSRDARAPYPKRSSRPNHRPLPRTSVYNEISPIIKRKHSV